MNKAERIALKRNAGLKWGGIVHVLGAEYLDDEEARNLIPPLGSSGCGYCTIWIDGDCKGCPLKPASLCYDAAGSAYQKVRGFAWELKGRDRKSALAGAKKIYAAICDDLRKEEQ